MDEHLYDASIMNAERDGLEDVDLRTVDTDRLHTLREEAGVAGDTEMVATIDSIIDNETDFVERYISEYGPKH